MDLTITITDPVLKPLDHFVVEAIAIDRDSIPRTLTVGAFKRNKDEATLISLLETLKKILDADNDKSHVTYEEGLGFLQWFKDCPEIDDLEYDYPDSAKVLNHNDLLSYEVFYYDINGVKYNVELS